MSESGSVLVVGVHVGVHVVVAVDASDEDIPSLPWAV